MKIVSLVPSITESLFDLSSPKVRIVGRTKFCIHPEDRVGEAKIIGGTKNLKIDEILILKPDLIIANKEENVKEQVEILQSKCEVLLTDISTLADNRKLLVDLGKIVDAQDLTLEFINRINAVFDYSKLFPSPKVAYVIWQKPFMVAGGDTFISDVLRAAGFENFFHSRRRYPAVELDELAQADSIFLSSEPYPFKDEHIMELKKKLGHSRIYLVDGEAFSWYGTHPAKCGDYYQNIYREVAGL